MRPASKPSRTRVLCRMAPEVRPSASLSGTISVVFFAATLISHQSAVPHDKQGQVRCQRWVIPFADKVPGGFDLASRRRPHELVRLVSHRGRQMVLWHGRASPFRLGPGGAGCRALHPAGGTGQDGSDGRQSHAPTIHQRLSTASTQVASFATEGLGSISSTFSCLLLAGRKWSTGSLGETRLEPWLNAARLGPKTTVEQTNS